jgi:hypothetical protein
MIKFEVKVIGHPKPKVRWLKHGEEIIPSDEFQIENLEDGTSILIINDVYPDDTGEIKFEAFNSVGVAETITQFVVEGKLLCAKCIKFSIFSIKTLDLQVDKDLQRNFPLLCSSLFFFCSFYTCH